MKCYVGAPGSSSSVFFSDSLCLCHVLHRLSFLASGSYPSSIVACGMSSSSVPRVIPVMPFARQ